MELNPQSGNKIRQLINKNGYDRSMIARVYIPENWNLNNFFIEKSKNENNDIKFRYAGRETKVYDIKEEHNIDIHKADPKYLIFRKIIIRFVDILTNNMQYGSRTYYLSIFIIDKLLFRYKPTKDELDLFCFMIIHITANTIECSSKILSFNAIEKLFSYKYNKKRIKKCEIAILEKLNFKLNISTAFDLTQVFINKGYELQNDIDFLLASTHKEKFDTFKDAVHMFIEFSANHFEFYKYSFLIVSSSCMYNARRFLNIEPHWPQKLMTITNISENAMIACADKMYNSVRDFLMTKKTPEFNKNKKSNDKKNSGIYSHLYEIQRRKEYKNMSNKKHVDKKQRTEFSAKKYFTYKDMICLADARFFNLINLHY